MSSLKLYGLIGKNLSHSFSPSYFASKFEKEKISDCKYSIYELNDISELKKVLPQGIQGFNVTMPFKKQIIPFLDQLSSEAKKVGAVNTVRLTPKGWYGYNTDVYGFELSLNHFKGKKAIRRAMVLGNGGAAKAIKFVLKKQGIKSTIISRKRGFRGYKNLDKQIVESHRLIINTTPLGMQPDVGQCPNIPYDYLGKSHLLFDLIYNPQKTLFLKKGMERGASVQNGMEMLRLQAEKSWEIWNR